MAKKLDERIEAPITFNKKKFRNDVHATLEIKMWNKLIVGIDKNQLIEDTTNMIVELIK